ncbi:MAG: YebC/PmpR family DNA-binding transcriptional regulator [Malacoplasma sp.]|nr:YebC/PmpR family DNA-binding transcriptional regulator [Malacoplasma sp.]MDE7099781.1 YebC/PmpR family DNA-binding transcriptional regulator [Malacoplasma sp.]
MPRKHLIASGINKKQQMQAKLGNKLAKEIKAAAKVGGTNPESNPRLKAAIDKALQNNLSKESIEKNINGSVKDPSSLIDSEYEGYGPSGLRIIVKTLSDNVNRTISSLRGYFSKLKGEIAKPNSVKNSFNHAGEIIVSKNNLSEDDLMEKILITLEKLEIVDNEEPIQETNEHEDCFQIIAMPKYFYKLRDGLKELKLDILESEIKYIPTDYTDLNKEEYARLERFLDSCNDDDDVQWVITNFGEVKD